MLFLLRVMSRKDAKGAKKKCVGDAKHVNPHNERSGFVGTAAVHLPISRLGEEEHRQERRGARTVRPYIF